MKKTSKNADHEPSTQFEKNDKQAKDYAHYPPTAAEQVKPPAHKHGDKKKDAAPNPPVQSTNDGAAEKKDAERSVNGSRKIVNNVDESYSDGSGGGFEATEQVND